ncbi:MAG TPA: FmdB family zinc ribbon protein [Vicinamibacterales bacterium]|nr:FmdB family zinc ribbon protein [Vicinamibacterales bacterium]
MPLFDFRCKTCGNEFEALVRAGDTPRCPACQNDELEKQLPIVAVSTDESRAANALKSRKAQIAKRKDAIVAEEEYREKHDKGDL